MFQWKHYASPDHRLDAASTNIMDLYVLTTEYYNLITQWINKGAVLEEMPQPQTPEDLRIAFSGMDSVKSISDEIIWHPVKFKILFGQAADSETRCTFQAVKLPNARMSDGEMKSRIVNTINKYFAIELWDFGEKFYFTELAAYIHQQLATEIASIVIVPLNESSRFGTLFEVKSASDEIFISTVTVADVQIVNNYTSTNMRIGR
jgi:hypothetical protein